MEVEEEAKLRWPRMIILIVIICYLAFKILYLNTYNGYMKEFSKYDKVSQIDISLNIETKELKEKQYINIDNIKIENIFKKYDLTSSNDELIRYELIKDDVIESSFEYKKEDKLIDTYIEDPYEIGLLSNKKEREEFLLNNKINNDLDLINYINNYQMKNNSIFTSINKMKQRYQVASIAWGIIPNIKRISYIDGNYQGYIINYNDNNLKYIIMGSDKNYVFSFGGTKILTIDKIESLLNTLVIN